MNTPHLYLLRHGQSEYQATYDTTGVDPGIEDPRLTQLGRAQVRAAAEAARPLEVDLIVASPFTRTLDTALGVSEDGAIPVVVDAMVRERLSDSSDVGRHASVLAREYPMLDLAHLEEVWWTGGGVPDAAGVLVESHAHMAERVAAFLEWLHGREERSVLLVSHHGFIRSLSGITPENGVLYEFDPAGRSVGVESMSTTVIRDLRRQEYQPAVQALLSAAQIHRTPEEATARGPLISAEYADSTELTLWGLLRDGEVAAVAGVEHRKSEGLVVLNDFAVDARSRRHGLGRQLIEGLRRQYPGAAIRGDTIAQAAAFYAALGFTLIEDGAMPNGEPLLRFSWSPPPRGWGAVGGLAGERRGPRVRSDTEGRSAVRGHASD